MNEQPRICRITPAMSHVLEKMIRAEFDKVSTYDFDRETLLLDMAAEFGLWELRTQLLKDSMIPNEKR